MKKNIRVDRELWDNFYEAEQQKMLQAHVADLIIQYPNLFDIKSNGEISSVIRVSIRNNTTPCYYKKPINGTCFQDINFEFEVEIIQPHVQPLLSESKESKMVELKVLVLNWCNAVSNYIREDDNSKKIESLHTEIGAWKTIEKFIEDEFIK